jgi:hypothetical protein
MRATGIGVDSAAAAALRILTVMISHPDGHDLFLRVAC